MTASFSTPSPTAPAATPTPARPQIPEEAMEKIAEQVLAASELDGPTSLWRMPWHGIGRLPENPITGTVYSSSNFMKLVTAQRRWKIKSPYWANADAWASKGGRLKLEARGVQIWKPITKKTDGPWKPRGPIGYDPLGGVGMEVIDYEEDTVFSHEDTEGADVAPPGDPKPFEVIEKAQKLADLFIQAQGPAIVHEGSVAMWRPDTDRVQMPPREAFRGSESVAANAYYYATLFHEFVHSTGSEGRFARKCCGAPKGSSFQAQEELVAELGAAMVCGRINLSTSLRQDHAAYVKHWRKKIEDKPQMLIWACTEGQRAARWILDSEKRLAAIKAKAEAEKT